MITKIGFKLYLISAIIILAFLSYLFDFHHYLSLSAMQVQRAYYADIYTQHPLLTITVFCFVYILVTVLSIPGATAVLTIVAGALFGIVTGFIIASFGSTIGATLAFLLSRFLLHDIVRKYFKTYLQSINRGLKTEGIFYLLALHITPIFPFFIISLMFGLTSMRAWTFYWVSQISMIPGTLIYVNAGVQISELESVEDILSPDLVIALMLLGIFPIITRIALRAYRKRHMR